ncbi:MAG: hypothetical protein ACTHMM_17765 [Agriterribacter sp.]
MDFSLHSEGPRRGEDNREYTITHDVRPKCVITITDLEVLQPLISDIPQKTFKEVDGEGTLYHYQIAVTEIYETADYDPVIDDCWEWWLELIR